MAARDWRYTYLAVGRPGCPSLLLENPYPKYPIAWRLGNYPAGEMFALYHVEKGFGQLSSISISRSSLRGAGATSL